MNQLLKNKKDIIDWLNMHNIENYSLVEDKKYGYLIDIYGSVNLSNQGIIKIEVKFNCINVNFFCSNNKLISLEAAPKKIGGDSYCNNNQLITLEGTPQ